MSYLPQAVTQFVTQMVQASPAAQQDPITTNIFLTEINNPGGSSTQQQLFQYLDQQFGQMWRSNQGVHPDNMRQALRNWLPAVFTSIQQYLQAQQQRQGPMYSQQPGQFGGYPQQPYMPTHMVNPGRGAFDMGGNGGPVSQQTPMFTPTVVPQQPVVQQPAQQTYHQPVNFKEGRAIVLELKSTSLADFDRSPDDPLEVSGYKTCEYEGQRFSTCQANLYEAVNTSRLACIRANASIPQQAVRGMFANVVDFQELCHVRMDHTKFKLITADIRTGIEAHKGDWRAGLAVLDSRTKEEWETLSGVLTGMINLMIHRFVRTSSGSLIERIDNLQDLKELDDRNSPLTVAQHHRYLDALNYIVARAFRDLTNPENLILAEDQNFGDFIQCSSVSFRHGGRSKYDYGTFTEHQDRHRFIQLMMVQNTVLRIPRKIIVTNALDPVLVRKIASQRASEAISVSDLNMPGTQLLGSIDAFNHSQVDAIHCVSQADLYGDSTMINVGKSLDGDLILLN